MPLAIIVMLLLMLLLLKQRQNLERDSVSAASAEILNILPQSIIEKSQSTPKTRSLTCRVMLPTTRLLITYQVNNK